MIHRAISKFPTILFLATLAGCAFGLPMIDPHTLPPEEYNKVKAVSLVDLETKDKASYHFIKKVSGVSCEVMDYDHSFWTGQAKWTLVKRSSRKEAEEQVKIHAVKAGGNAIANLACAPDSGYTTGSSREKCYFSVLCSADAIHIN